MSIIAVDEDCSLLSKLEVLSKEYPIIEITNIDATGVEQNRAVYFFKKDQPRRGNVFLELWYNKREDKLSFILFKSLLTSKELEEADSNRRPTAFRGSLYRYGMSLDNMLAYIRNKIGIYLDSGTKSRYIVKTSNDEKYGRFNSWIIRNEDLAIKETDKSVFEFKGSGIPREIRWFFKAEDLSPQDEINLTFIYQDKEYRAYIKKEATHGRTRMFWYADLSERFNDYYRRLNRFPYLLFERDGGDRFKISFKEDINQKVEEPLDNSHSLEEQENHAQFMDIQSLRCAAVKRGSERPEERETIVKQYTRDPYISEYAKRRSGGICDLCHSIAPFSDLKERPYLESHHVRWLSEGGTDTIDNVVALCPNCHRKMHVLRDEDDVNKLKSVLTQYNMKITN